MNDQDIEHEVMDESSIVSEYYFTAGDGVQGAWRVIHANGTSPPIPHSLFLITFCVLTLRNGSTVTGESIGISPRSFCSESGRQIARKNAIAKIGPLMAYSRYSKLASRMRCTCTGPNQGCSSCPPERIKEWE